MPKIRSARAIVTGPRPHMVTLKIEADERKCGFGDTHHWDETGAIFPHAYAFSDGSLHPTKPPGAYPPESWLENGSIFNR